MVFHCHQQRLREREQRPRREAEEKNISIIFKEIKIIINLEIVLFGKTTFHLLLSTNQAV